MEFRGALGLYQLIFYEQASYNKGDAEQYKQLLIITSAHFKKNGTLKTSSIFKYNEIIIRLFQGVRYGSGYGHGLSFTYNEKLMDI